MSPWVVLRNVPRSQVWAGSRGGHRGRLHLRATEPFESGRLRREPGLLLCGAVPWHTESPEAGYSQCPRCLELAERYEIEWPEIDEAQRP